jgi:uncharacterized membrane protein YidH (DUF202 family)
MMVDNPMDVRNKYLNTNGEIEKKNAMLKILATKLKSEQIKIKNIEQLNLQKETNIKSEEKQIKIFLLGIITAFGVASAFSWNETIKYFINRAIKFNNGSPNLYIYYSVGMSVLSLIVFSQSKRMIN